MFETSTSDTAPAISEKGTAQIGLYRRLVDVSGRKALAQDKPYSARAGDGYRQRSAARRRGRERESATVSQMHIHTLPS